MKGQKELDYTIMSGNESSGRAAASTATTTNAAGIASPNTVTQVLTAHVAGPL